MESIKTKLADWLTKNTELPKEKIIELLEIPKNPEFGDLAFPCVVISKNQNPVEFAKNFANQIKPPLIIDSISSKSIYINFKLNKKWLVKTLMKDIFEEHKIKKKKEKIMIEFSQPNTHKAFHIGHLRNCVLGQTLVNIMRMAGYDVIAVNYIGDIGTHVAKSLWYINKYVKKLPTKDFGKWLSDIYVKANKLVSESEEFKKEVDEVHKRLDNKEKKWITLWEKTKQYSLDDFNRIYKELDVKFDVIFYESKVADEGKEIANLLLKKGIAKRDKGCLLIDLKKYNLDVFLILKSDGTPLYSTKDLSLAKHKFEDYNISKSIYVVGSEQIMYFKQLFKTLELMGFRNAKNCYHLSYGLVQLKEGKMSSRLGNIIRYDDLMKDVLEKAKTEVKKRHPDWQTLKRNETAKQIALSAIKFSMLSKDAKRTIVFEPDKAIRFDGETGPYIQYVYTRCNSILNKAKINLKSFKPNYELLTLNDEIRIIKMLSQFDEKAEAISKNYQLHTLSRWLLDLSQAFNNYYENYKIIIDNQDLMVSRLYLIFAIKETIHKGLALLGIKTLNEM